MKGLIDKTSGTTLPRLLQRLLDRGVAGELTLHSQPEGKTASIILRTDQVDRVALGTLMGDSAMREIQSTNTWEYEFVAGAAPTTTRPQPKVLRTVVRTSPAAGTAIAPTPIVRPQTPIAVEETPIPITSSPATPEPIPAVEPASVPEPTPVPVPVLAEATPLPPTDDAFQTFAMQGGNFTSADFPPEESAYFQSDYYFQYHQVSAIGKTIGLSHPRLFSLIEDSPYRAVGYRGRGSDFSGVQAKDITTLTRIISAL